MPQLDSSWFASQVFWLVALFVFLHVALRWLILPRFSSIMERRAQTREGDLAAAQSFKDKADAARLAYEQSLRDSRAGAQAAIAKTNEEARQRADAANADLDRALSAKMAQAEAGIAQKKRETMQKLAPAAAEIASLIVEKLLHSKPSPEQAVTAVADASAKKN